MTPTRLAVTMAAAAMIGARVPSVAHGLDADVKPPTVLWSVAAEGWGQPASDGRSVYFLTRSHDVVAVRAADGEVRWRARTQSSRGVPDGSRLVVAGGVVVAGDYDLYAFDASTGRLRWRFAPAQGHGPGYYLGDPADGVVYAGSPAGLVYAVDAASGAQLWAVPVTTVVGPTTAYAPVATRDLVIAPFTVFDGRATGGVVALDARTGVQRWRRAGQPWAGGPVAGGDFAVVATNSGMLTSLSTKDGSVRWTVGAPETAEGSVRDFRPLVCSRDLVVAGSLSGSVTAYDAGTRRRLWESAMLRLGSVGPAFAASAATVYVPFVSGRLVAFDLQTGAVRWVTAPAQGAFRWAPVVADRAVYAAGDAVLQAFDR